MRLVHAALAADRCLQTGNLLPALQIRSELAEKGLILLQKEQELLERDQTLVVLKEEVSWGPGCRPAGRCLCCGY